MSLHNDLSHFSVKVNLHCITKCEDTTDNFTPSDLMVPLLDTYADYYDHITVAHLRRAVKCKHKIPEICQKEILYIDGPILDYTLPLSAFHFKPSDCLEVLYYATVKVDIIDEILFDIDSLAGTCQRFSHRDDEDIRQILLRMIRHQESFLQNLTFIVFLPWNCPETEAGKLYFVSRGGLDKLIGMLRWTIEMGQLGPSLDVIVEFEKNLFLALWGFADTFQEKLLLLQSDCLQAVMRVLTDNMGHKDLVHHALGLTQKLMEIPEARGIMIDNPKYILNIAECLKTGIESVLISNARFPAATIICRLSHSTNSHKILTEDTIFNILLHVLRETTTKNGHIFFFLKYLLLQVFMNILINPSLPSLPCQTIPSLRHLMTSFLKDHNWSQLFQYETKNEYNCSTIVPFIHALFIPKRSQVYRDAKLMELYLLVTMMSLRNVLHQANKQQLLIQEHLQDFLTIARWYLPPRFAKELGEMMDFFDPGVPSLQNIAITKLGIEENGFQLIQDHFT